MNEIQRVLEIHAALDAAHLHMAADATSYTIVPHRDGSIAYTYTRAEIESWSATKAAMIAGLRLDRRRSYMRRGVFHGSDISLLDSDHDAKQRGLYMTREMLSDAVTTEPVEGGKAPVLVPSGSLVQLPIRLWTLETPGYMTEDNEGWLKILPHTTDHLRAKDENGRTQIFSEMIPASRNCVTLANPHTGPSAAEVREAYVLGKHPAAEPEPERVDRYNPDGLKPEVRAEFEKARRVAMDEKDTRSGNRDRLVAALKAEMGASSAERLRLVGKVPEGRSDRVYGYRRWEPRK